MICIPPKVHAEVTDLTVCVRRVLEVVDKRNKDAGNEASQREQHHPHREVGERELDEGPVPVKAAVTLEHPGLTTEDTLRAQGRISAAHDSTCT